MITRFLYLPALLGYIIHIVLHLWNEPNTAFQDDMRQHVLGLYRLPDFFGSYYSATVPLGIGWLNQFTSWFVSPLTWARWIQPPFIAVLTTFFSWQLGNKFFSGDRVKEKSFLLVFLLQALIWSGDDLISSTPRSWAVLCMLALLDAAFAKHKIRFLITLFLTSVIYSPLAIVGFGLLFLIYLDCHLFLKKSFLTRSNLTVFLLTFLGLAGVAFYQSYRISSYGPTIVKKEAKVLPEYNPGGRAHYFSDDPIDFWIKNSRGGLMPKDTQVAWVLLAVSVLCFWRNNFSIEKLSRDRRIFWLGSLFLGSFLLFLLAHAFWFKLFHPNRYLQFIIPMIACLMASHFFIRKKMISFCLPPVLFLLNYTLANQNYHYEEEANDLVRAQIPKSVSATLAVFPTSDLGNALPLLEQIPIVASEELSLPYHQSFYQVARERLTDTYSLWVTYDKDEIIRYFEKYQVTHILLEREAWLEKTKLSEPWHTAYHERLISQRPPLLKQVLGNEKKKILSRVELFQEINQPSFRL